MSVDTPREGLDPDGLIAESIVDEAALQARIREMGAQIAVDYAGKDLLLVGVLKGAVLFMSDLIRAIPMPCEVDFMAISSYGSGTENSGIVRILKDLDDSIEGRDVLIVEDIIDSGLTLSVPAAQPARAAPRQRSRSARC